MVTPETGHASEANLLPTEADVSSMQEFYRLQWWLMLTTLILSTVIFAGVWLFYSSNIALNYLLGAYTGVVYLKVLARNVGQLGREKIQLGKSHLAIFIGLIILATQLNQLQVMPVFLGFLTYKITLLLYMLRTFITSGD